jgi:predicted nuclease of predicted toxin-antitoxin system
MKLLLDMNLSPRWVGVLSTAGFKVIHWSSVGLRNATDVSIMQYARDFDFVVLTHDLDFGDILAATDGEKPSVVQLRSGDVSPEVMGTQVIASLGQMTAELIDGALLTIGPGRTRIRLLPLKSKQS